MTEMEEPRNTRRSQSWPLVVFVVILIGVGGLFLIRTADTDGELTLGEAMITAALVAGPFLIAEVLLKEHEHRRDLRPAPLVDGYAGEDLTDADLSDRYLRRRSFSSTRLSRANLTRSDLAEATFDDARLTRTDLSFANLRAASLKSASCFRANFEQAILTNADLRWANLKQANLRNAELVDADLENADLRGADLTDADLRGTRLAGARYSDTTVFPAEIGGEEDLMRLGLCRHPDEMIVERLAQPSLRFGNLRSMLRSATAVGAAAAIIAGVNFALPEQRTPPSITTPRVSGVVLERPYYRITGTAQSVTVSYRSGDGTRETVTFDALPASIAIDLVEPISPLDVVVESHDTGTVHCEIFVGGDLVSQAGSAGRGGIASCAASS